MPDILTPFLKLVKQTIGGNRNTWGGILNSNMDAIERGVSGLFEKVVVGGSYTLTDTEWPNRILSFTGALASDQTIEVPNLSSVWKVNNATTGAFALKFKTSAGTAVAVPQGGHADVWCDGFNVMRVGLSTNQRDTQATAPSGTLAAPGISWAAELNSGWYRVSSQLFALVINATEKIRIGADLFKLTLGAAVDVIVASSTSFVMTLGSARIFTATPTGVDFGVAVTVNGASLFTVGMSTDYDGIFEPSGWKFRNGQSLSRTTFALLFGVITASANATRNGSTALSSVSVDFTGLGLEGSKIEGTGIPSNTTIVSLTANSITLSQAAAGSGSIAIRIFPHGNGDGATTFNVPDDMGRVNPGRDNMGGTSANRLTGLAGGIDGDKLGTVGGTESQTITQANLPSGVSLTTSIAAGQGSHVHPVANSAGIQNFGGSQSAPGNFTAPPGPSNTSTATLPAMTGTTDLGGSGTTLNNVQPSRVTNKIIFTGTFV